MTWRLTFQVQILKFGCYMWGSNLPLLREKLKVLCSLLTVGHHIGVRVNDEIFVSASLTCFDVLLLFHLPSVEDALS